MPGSSRIAGAAAVAAAALLSFPAFAGNADPPAAWRERGDLTARDRERVAAVTAPATDFSKPEKFEEMPGGAGTSRKLVNRDAFSQFSANLTFEGERDFKLGNALFRKTWVSSPASTQASDGLGPLFNARGCQECHEGREHGRIVGGCAARPGAAADNGC